MRVPNRTSPCAATTPAMRRTRTKAEATQAKAVPAPTTLSIHLREVPRAAFVQVDLVNLEDDQVQLKLALADEARTVLIRASQVFARRLVTGETASCTLLARLRPVLTGQARYGRGLRQLQRGLVEAAGLRSVQRAVDDLRGRLRTEGVHEPRDVVQ